MKLVKIFSLIIFCMLLVTSCKHTQQNTDTKLKNSNIGPFGTRSASEYLPLNLGNSWTYERDFLGEIGEMKVMITGMDKFGFFRDNHGGILKHTQMGLKDKQRYMLLAPLEAGHRWRVQIEVNIAEHFEIIEDNATIEVPAGKFENCLIVKSVINYPNQARMVSTIAYAPKVGIIFSEVSLENNQKRKERQMLLKLKSYSFPK